MPLDPLKISGISIGEAGGSVSVKQEYKNVEVHGLTKNLEKRNFKYVSILNIMHLFNELKSKLSLHIQFVKKNCIGNIYF